MVQYSYRKLHRRYAIFEDNHFIGITEYEPIAKRCVVDAERYGSDSYEKRSALSWMKSGFSKKTHEECVETINNSFDEPEWTWELDLGGPWNAFVGNWGYRRQMIPEWLSKASVLQLTAAYEFGKVYESLNLSFSLAMLMEQKDGPEREAAIDSILETLSRHPKYHDKEKNRAVFELFELFYGIHLTESGPVLTDLIENDKKHSRKELTLETLPLYTVSEDWLRGRNYRPYAGAESQEQWWDFLFGKGLEDFLGNDAENPEKSMVSQNVPAKYCNGPCWVKRYIVKGSPDKHYVVIVYVDKDWNIIEGQCLLELPAKPLGDGGDTVESFRYKECANPPKQVLDDLYKLVTGRFLFTGISFVGKKPPNKINRLHSYTVLSPYRPVAMTLRFSTNEDGFIDGFEYATHRVNSETGNAMVTVEDSAEEKVETLLSFFDLYDNRQWLTEIAFPDDNVTIRNRKFEKMSTKEWIRFISENPLTKEDLGWLYCWVVHWRGLLTDEGNFLELTKAFFEHGMDPNQVVSDEYPDGDWSHNSYENPMLAAVQCEVDAAGVASLKYLMEHGGDPNTINDYWCPGVYMENVFDWFEEDEFANGGDEYLPERTIYGMILTWAYGGKRACDDWMPYQMLIDAPPTILKDYERYWFEYSNEEGSKHLYIVEKATGRRVARYF